MKVDIENKTLDSYSVSKLIWTGKKDNSMPLIKEQEQLLKTFFPNNKLEFHEFPETDDQLVSKRFAIQYMQWAERNGLNNIGLFCNEPMGFPNWRSYIDFIRKDPPAFLWKVHDKNELEINKILIPVDFSSGTERVFSFLNKMVDNVVEREVVLLNLFEHHDSIKTQAEFDGMISDKIDEMKWFVDSHVNINIQSKLRLDALPRKSKSKAVMLDEYIHNNDVDLMILGSHNFNHYHYLLYGSTSSDVLNASLPVQVCVLFK